MNHLPLGFEFEHPAALLLLALLPLWSWLRGRAGRSGALTYPDASLLAGIGRPVREAAGRLRPFLRLLTAACLIVVLAGPRTANREVERDSEGVDIFIVADLSWSMLAMDMDAPEKEVTRWAASRQVIHDFVKNRPDDRIGAVVFSGKPYLLSPLTVNKEWIDKGINRMHIGIIREVGTAIGDAMAMAVDRMKSLPKKSSKVIILLTDGDDNQSKSVMPVPSAELAAAFGIRVHTIGLGKDEPTMLPQFNVQTGEILRDPLGRPIPMQTINPANYEMLKTMAKVGGGKFFRALDREQLRRVYAEIDRLERTEVRIRESVSYDDHRLAWLSAAALLLLAEMLWALRRQRAP
ncbi:MAG: VWA domain-containing protein [Opitutales bacterium]